MNESELSDLKSYRRRCKKDLVHCEQFLLGAANEYTRAQEALWKVDHQIRRLSESQQAND